MKKYVITAETTCDLTKELLDKHGFKTVPIAVILDADMYRDGVDIDTDRLFDYVKQTGKLPKTSAVAVGEYEEFFSELKKEYECFHKSSSKYYSSHNLYKDITNADEIVIFGLSFGRIDYSYFYNYFSLRFPKLCGIIIKKIEEML